MEILLEALRQLLPRPVARVVPVWLKAALRRWVRGAQPAAAAAPPVLSAVASEPPVTVIRDLAGLEKKLQELDAAAALSDDALRAAFLGFRMEFSVDVPPDPHSDAYRRQQFDLYARLAGKPYSNSNEVSAFDVTACAASPFPFFTQSSSTVGRQLMGIGFLIQAMALAPKSRVLEFGPGWGNTTEFLARMGMAVTAVDIEQNFVDLIRERARRVPFEVEAVCADFSWIESVQQPYDAILFFECFHHASDHLRLMRAFDKAVKPGGRIVFAAEPIDEGFALPWGLRLDGESLWAIRRHGWLELGFKESYFRDTLRQFGWKLDKQVCAGTPWGTVFIATRA